MRSALQIYAQRRVLSMWPLGFASGLPLLLTGSTLSAWLSQSGRSLSQIGVLSLVGLPYALKILWAPLLDRFAIPVLGRRRGWMLASQVMLCVCLLGMSQTCPQRSTAMVSVLSVLIAFLSASQDIVMDAYRTELLRSEERAAGTAVFVFGYRVAMLCSGGLALIVADHHSFQLVYALAALLLLFGSVITLLVKEPPATRPPQTLRSAVIDPLRDYFGRAHALAILLFITLYRVGDTLAGVMLMPFFLSLRFTQTEIGVVYKVIGVAATIVGTLLGGLLTARLGLARALLLFGCSQAGSNVCYALLAVVGKSQTLLVVAVGVDHLCTGLAIAALDALLMSLCNRRFSAMQYALLVSVSSVLGRVIGGSAGVIANRVGWPLFFLLTAVLSVPAVVLWHYLQPSIRHGDEDADGHQVLSDRA